MKTSESISELALALCAAQSEMPIMRKDSSVNMELKSGRKIQYDYIELGAIVSQSKSILSKNGLCIIQPRSTIDDKPVLITMLIHNKSGQFIQTHTQLDLANKTEQERGSVITYNSRYDYVGMLRLGLLDEDDDGVAASGNKKIQEQQLASISEYRIKTKGNAQGKMLSELKLEDIQRNINYWTKRAKDENTILKGTVKQDVEASIQYLKEQEK